MINIRKTGFACTAAVLLAAFGASLGQAQDRGVVRAADDGLLEGLFQTEIVNIGLESSASRLSRVKHLEFRR